MDETTEGYGNRKPREGDATLCAKCAHIGVFNKDLTIRNPTAKEYAMMSMDPRIIEAQIMIRGMHKE